MKVFLLKDVKGVGRKFEVKNVSDGFALNNLIPKKFAEPVTESNIAKIEKLKQKMYADNASTQKEQQEVITKISGQTIETVGKVNDKGHLFAAISVKDIVDLINHQFRVIVKEGQVSTDKPVKEIGEHKVLVMIGDKSATLTLLVK